MVQLHLRVDFAPRNILPILLMTEVQWQIPNQFQSAKGIGKVCLELEIEIQERGGIVYMFRNAMPGLGGSQGGGEGFSLLKEQEEIFGR